MTRTARAPAAAALAHPPFRRYYAGIWCSTLAFWMLRLALGWSAWETSRSSFWTGVVAALSMLPPALLAPLFGVVVDRVRLSRAVPLAVLAFAALAGLAAVLAASGRLALAPLCAIAAAQGLVAAAWQPLRLALPARLVPREALPAAIGLVALTFQSSRVAGPAIGGATIAAFGVAALYALVALTYLGFLASFLGVALRPRTRDGSDDDPFLDRFVAGLRVAFAMRETLPVLAATVVVGVVARGALELLPAIAGGRLGTDAAGLGWLTSAAGTGAVCAALLSARASGAPEALARRLLANGASACLATVLVGSAGTLGATALACAATAFCATLTGVACQSLLQLRVDDAYRARVLSLWTMAGFGGAFGGTLALGALGDRVGLDVGLRLLGGAGAIAFALLWLRERRPRRSAARSR